MQLQFERRQEDARKRMREREKEKYDQEKRNTHLTKEVKEEADYCTREKKEKEDETSWFTHGTTFYRCHLLKIEKKKGRKRKKEESG